MTSRTSIERGYVFPQSKTSPQTYADLLVALAADGRTSIDPTQLNSLGNIETIFDGSHPLSSQSYDIAIRQGLCNPTIQINNPFARQFLQIVKVNVTAAIKKSPQSPEGLVNQSLPFLEACTDIAVELVNAEKPDLELHKRLAQAVNWFQKIDIRQRPKVQNPENLAPELANMALAVDATFELLAEVAPITKNLEYQEARIVRGKDIQTHAADHFQKKDISPEFAQMISTVEEMSALTQKKDKDMLSVVETAASAQNPAIHAATSALLCVHALDVRRDLSDTKYPHWRVFRSVVETLPDGKRALFCRVKHKNKKQDEHLEKQMQRAIANIKRSVVDQDKPKESVFVAEYTARIEDVRRELGMDKVQDSKHIDLEIRGSAVAIADNTEYQIEPDENLKSLGVSQISIEMQGSVYMVNIITAQGANTITLSPDELSGLVTNIETPAQGMNTSMLELLAKLAIAKTKEWISSQYNYDPDKTQTDEVGMSVAKRSPHLELLPLGANCRQYGRRDYEDQMQTKYGTTPGELNDALVLAQVGWDNLKTMPPHIAKMVEELVLRAMERGEKSGYQVMWEDQPQSTDPVLYQNGQRVVISNIDTLQNGKKYDKDRHFFQVSFVPGIDDGQRRQVMLKLQFPEIAQVSNTPQSGSVYALK